MLIFPQNWIKVQAHDHLKFRAVAARYGQTLHQINMRMQVTLLRDIAAERRAKEKAEAPTVKTAEQVKADEAREAKEKAGEHTPHITHKEAPRSVWRRKFRPLPENKAVDLFADVIGDSFILLIASALIMFEYFRSKEKPDVQGEKMAEFKKKLEELEQREHELEEMEKKRQVQVEVLEKALEELKKGKGKMSFLRS